LRLLDVELNLLFSNVVFQRINCLLIFRNFLIQSLQGAFGLLKLGLVCFKFVARGFVLVKCFNDLGLGLLERQREFGDLRHSVLLLRCNLLLEVFDDPVRLLVFFLGHKQLVGQVVILFLDLLKLVTRVDELLLKTVTDLFDLYHLFLKILRLHEVSLLNGLKPLLVLSPLGLKLLLELLLVFFQLSFALLKLLALPGDLLC